MQLLEEMRASLGVQEVKGPGTNPEVERYFADCGWKLDDLGDDDTVAWCAARVGSALKRCGYPIPPTNVNLTARSYATYGVDCKPQPGAIGVIPRGTSGWQGHVFVIEEVLANGTWQTIGGNQGREGYGKVSRVIVDPQKVKILGVRLPVPATVKDLRAAGSTTIKSNDTMEKVAIATTFFTPIVEGVKSLFEGAPNLSSVQGLTYWEALGKVAGNVFAYANAHPYMVAICIVGGGLWLNSHLNKRARVAEHAAGIPIAGEVAKLQGA